MQKELIYSYNGSRCHAKIKNFLPEKQEAEKIGNLKGYAIYKLKSVIFNQFDFIAIEDP